MTKEQEVALAKKIAQKKEKAGDKNLSRRGISA